MRVLRVSDFVSAIALLFSVYNFWQSSQKPADLKVFVPPVISYASPYQNSNFEAFAIPVTIINEGARTGTILSMALIVTDLQNNVSKRFYSANFGAWTIEKSRTGDFRPFAPISLAGRASYTDTVQFYARNDEKVMQIVPDAGRYKFTLTLDTPNLGDGFFDRFMSTPNAPVSFEMLLAELDHRAFTSGNGTVALHHKDWQSSANLQ
jgi:hypothetical protein